MNKAGSTGRVGSRRDEQFYGVVAWVFLAMAVVAGVVFLDVSACLQFVTLSSINGGVSAIMRRLREVSE